MKILYNTEKRYLSFLSLKITGHQWYWSYELRDFKNNPQVDCFIKKENETTGYRLLETDRYITLPISTPIRCLISSTDVIHS